MPHVASKPAQLISSPPLPVVATARRDHHRISWTPTLSTAPGCSVEHGRSFPHVSSSPPLVFPSFSLSPFLSFFYFPF
ncbi:hypothetical protein M6B38_305490 [Iris pallida]|uniref:Uncharacterized protein n=1 Tax=Iris pallida TaxID=29817 RepID=A0AAX6HLH7_IRIPA|nr:hypothetical protein M6B38_305490 [Iris pallida]